MYKKLEISFAILGVMLSVTLFLVGSKIREIQDSFDSHTFNGSIFLAKHDALVAFNALGLPLNRDGIISAYKRYFFEVNNRVPTESEISSIKTIQDYFEKVGHTTSTTFDFELAGRSRNLLSSKKNNLQSWETRLFIFLVLSQFLTLYFSRKSDSKKN